MQVLEIIGGLKLCPLWLARYLKLDTQVTQLYDAAYMYVDNPVKCKV